MYPSDDKQEVRRKSLKKLDHGAVLNYVNSKLNDMKNSRIEVEETWVESWAQYLATHAAQNELRAQQIKSVGNVGTDWRHKIDRGKAFEIVETIHAYLMGALFPNENWFDIEPRNPSDTDLLRVLRKFLRDELKDLEFDIKFDDFVRQLIITGNSCLFFPWDDDDDAVEIELVNVFDFWLDAAGKDPSDTNVVRRVMMTRAEVMEKTKSDEFPLTDEYEVLKVHGTRSYNKFDKVRQFQGLQSVERNSVDEFCEIYEYWGCIIIDGCEYEDVVVTFADNLLLNIQPNLYKSGTPMIYCNFIPVVDMVYGIGALQSSLGMIHVLNILTNQRLDGIELTTSPMWTKKPSSTLDAEDLYAEPGRVLEVDDHDDIKPIPPSQWNIQTSYEEANYMESSIDKNAATGPLIGAGMGRSGERVTAAEIAAVREAGGNRLSGIHRRLEKRGLTKAIDKIFNIYRQYKSKAAIVRYAGDEAGKFDYARITRSDLVEVRVDAKGSDHVIEKRKALQDIYDFLGAVNQDSEMATLIDKEAVLRRVMRHLPFDDPQEFLKTKKAPENPIRQMGGQSAVNAIEQQMQTDGGNQLLNQLKDSYGQPATITDGTEPTVSSAAIDPNLGQSGNLIG
ncbi:MAG: hypothetical protein AN484_07040 [Aphanizomenon flos-aquae WA102]|jgi:hypothetical protein|uniref:Portal protein n=1 Tax=Aphanizomenon flos-aquae WA102 TaxID=1710896 RepID=A0A1B7X554_APHFL|nr:MAG: hypothetical protein AN484_07040 [Aphanizomenon flos-aquae WA102]